MYATLGTSCRNCTDVLLSNTKFITPSDPVYRQFLTKMDVYPGGGAGCREEGAKENDKDEAKEGVKEGTKDGKESK